MEIDPPDEPAALNRFSLTSHGGLNINQVECALGNTVSQYSEQDGIHELTLKMTSKHPFEVEQGSIQRIESRFTRDYGTLFFKTKIDEHFRLLDLPLEIRFNIYEKVLLLKPDLFRYFDNKLIDEYDWETFGEQDWIEWNEGAWEEPDVPFHPEFRIKDPYQSKEKTRIISLAETYPKGHTNLLSTCRQIADEAGQVFYGAPEYIFDNTTTLSMFLTTIGSNRSLLKRIRVSNGLIYSSTPSAVRLLAEASKLHSLHLCSTHEQALNERSPRRFLELLRPLYTVLLEREQDLGRALKVISWTQHVCTCRVVAGEVQECGNDDEEHMPPIWLNGFVLKHWKLVEEWYDKSWAPAMERLKIESAKAQKVPRKRPRISQPVDEDFIVPLKLARSPVSSDAKPSRRLPGRKARRTTDYAGLAENSDDDLAMDNAMDNTTDNAMELEL